MTDVTDSTPTPDPAAPAPPARRWKLIAVVAAAAGMLAVGIAVFTIARDEDGDQPQTAATQQMAAARQACQQWLDNDTISPGTGPGAGWCDDMAGWMSDNVANGQMMGPMMWDSPEAMRDRCVQAIGSGPPANDNPSQWCDQMVTWMSQHTGNWDNWHDYRDN
jgi:hypothetical protein